MFTTDLLVNLCNRNIFKTSLCIYIFQDEKCCLMRNLSLSMVLTPIANKIELSGSGVDSSRDCSRVDRVLFKTLIIRSLLSGWHSKQDRTQVVALIVHGIVAVWIVFCLIFIADGLYLDWYICRRTFNWIWFIHPLIIWFHNDVYND